MAILCHMTAHAHADSAAPVDTNRVVAKAMLRAADLLSLRPAELAQVVDLSESTLSRLRSSLALEGSSLALEGSSLSGFTKDSARSPSERSLLFIRIFRSLDALMGGAEAQARLWLTAHNHHLGGVPIEQMKHIEGLVEVAQYLDAMRAKA